MIRWQTSLGVVIGLVLGFAIVSITGSAARKRMGSGPILPECEGQLRELVIHYEPAAKPVVEAVYRDFLGALGPEVTVHAVCPDTTAYQDLRSLLGEVKCTLSPIVTQHPITTWSRDRWVALAPASPGEPTTLWMPRAEAAEKIWPARAGDERVGGDIAATLAPAVLARRSGLYFDGGDFFADSENVFVMPRVPQRNIQITVGTRRELLSSLARELKRRVILLDEAPDHHAGMFMASVGEGTLLVGDPGLGRERLAAQGPEDGQAATGGFLDLPGGADFTPATQRLFDAVAARCSAEGYQVVRIPVVPARDGRTYLTYLNVLMETSGPRRIVYMPVYQGAEALNNAARNVWTRLGFEVRPIDCTAVYRHFGCLHCLVNVMKRS